MRNFSRYLAHAFIVGCLSFGLAAGSYADSLFNPSGKSIALKAEGDRTVVRQKLVTLDKNVLAAAIHDTKDDLGGNRESRSMALSGKVEIDLFNGRSISLQRASVTASPEGGVVWNGTGSGDDYAALAVANGNIVGVIEADGRTYHIDPAGPGLHVLKEVNTSGYKRDRHIDRPKLRGELPASDVIVEPRATTYIGVLFAYTSRAETALTAGGATLAQVFDRDLAITNRGMSNSNVPVVLRRKAIKAVTSTYSENTPDPVTPLYDLTSGTTANFAAIRQSRASVNGDLVAMYIKRTSIAYCGVAWLNQPNPSANWAFSVVEAPCAGSVTLAHELGHTMGLYHDRYVHASAPNTVYNYGFVSVAGNFRDIMSYPDKCIAAKGSDCARKTYYSKPGKTINGVAAGVPVGSPGAANAARWLREKRGTIAKFR